MSRFAICGLTILLAFAPAALAVDGTVLINQSTITNGLTGCPTGGHFPIIICQPGSYRLSGNLTVTDANTRAITLTADNVTLDLNGFSILGPVVCSGLVSHLTCSPSGNADGIFSGNSYIAVFNGTIRGVGGVGITLPGEGVRVESVNAVSNGNGGISVGNDNTDGIVTLCHATFNGGFGILGGGTLSNSSASGNNGDGASWDGLATGNISSSNGGNGFSGSGTFMGNTVGGNSAAGINALLASVIISNALYSNKIIAPSGSVVLNNVVQ